jgi:hypothetical protein
MVTEKDQASAQRKEHIQVPPIILNQTLLYADHDLMKTYQFFEYRLN